ncbi:MAG: alcohol dehydrogenase catalytic domain-containing protein [Lachnospiraceae bacterium]|nr:alcohol dehydrogenase catalytic domain-containing protein [Lachnospiraceae bacterium]
MVIKVAYAGICGTDRHEYTGPNFIPVKTLIDRQEKQPL